MLPTLTAAAAASTEAAAEAVKVDQRHSGSPTPVGAPEVVVTREAGKNTELLAALQNRGVSVLELPLIQHAEGPDLCVILLLV